VVRKVQHPLVAKLGGSLAGSRSLMTWLLALDRYPGPLVIVPGGGALAEAVRTMQEKMHFDDSVAHHLALVAMEQYGLALKALWPRLACVATQAAIAHALRTRQVACWAPTRMVLASSVAKSWDATSDTLAAWLAGELRAEKLLLIKSADIGVGHGAMVGDLVRAGTVDPLFPLYAAASNATIFIAGPASLPDAATLLAQDQVPGARVCV
jgi:dihydroneopterin aldolase